ncbi:MAG: type II secretion system protein N [Lysobacterales bacterium]
MKRRLWLVGLVVAAIAGAMIVQMPASVVEKRLAEMNPALTLQQVSGTIWRGTFRQASWQGYALGTVSWSLSAVSVFTLRPQLSVWVDGINIAGQTKLRRQWGGAVVAQDSQMTLPATWLQHILNQPMMGLGGQLEIALDHAQLDDEGWLVALTGEAWWRDAAVRGGSGNGQWIVLGDLGLNWQTLDEGAIQGTLKDSGGELALDGKVSIANHAYRVRAQLAPRNGDPRLREALQLFGRPDASGQVRLDIFGPLVALREL